MLRCCYPTAGWGDNSQPRVGEKIYNEGLMRGLVDKKKKANYVMSTAEMGCGMVWKGAVGPDSS